MGSGSSLAPYPVSKEEDEIERRKILPVLFMKMKIN